MKKILLAIITLISVALSVAQTPGGVSTGMTLWLKANGGVSTSGSSVTDWADVSGNANNVTSNVASAPTLVSNSVNFNPTIRFNGTNQNLINASGLVGSTTQSDAFIYVVHNTHTIQESFLFTEGAGTRRFSIHLPWSNSSVYWDYGSSSGLGRVLAPWGAQTNRDYLWAFGSSTGTSTPSGTRKSVFRDGTLVLSNDDNKALSGSSSSFFLGSGNGSLYSDMDLSELIVYFSTPSLLEMQRVESYLGIKYGLTIAHNYLASDGTLLWDQAANAVYHNNIIGIGRDDISGLSQQKSLSETGRGGLIVDNLINFDVDKEFVIIGDNDLNGVTYVNPPTGYLSSSNRIWKVEEHGDVSNNTVRIIMSEIGVFSTGFTTDYALLIDPVDTDFSAGTTIITGGTFSGDTLTFTGVDLADGFMALASNAVSPGGVVNGMSLWLKADRSVTTTGSSVTDWGDNSGNGKHATSAVATAPLLVNSAVNFNPTLRFDGVDQNLEIPQGLLARNEFSDAFVYAVHNTNAIQASFMFSEGLGTEKFVTHVPWNNNSVYWDFGSTGGLGRIFGPWGGQVGQDHLWSFGSSTGLSTPSGTRKSVYRDGIIVLSNDDNKTLRGNNTPFFVGSLNSAYYSAMDLSELIIYFATPSLVEKEQVESYLAIKYGLTIDHNYRSSDGSVIWDRTANSSYHKDIIGLGRDDVSGLYQKQSRTGDDSLKVYVDGIAGDNGSNTGTVTNDKSFVLFGHNGGKLHGIKTEQPAGIYARLEREWQVVNSNFTDSYSLAIEWDSVNTFDITDIRLLVDTDGDFSNATVYGPADGLSFSNGSIVVSGITGAHIPVGSSRFVTIGSTSSDTPLPITLMKFEAEEAEKKVKLEWATAQEVNSDFVQVERSNDGSSWTKIGTVKTKGNTTVEQFYTLVDSEPKRGVNYYRLKSVDFDGSYEYSKIISISLIDIVTLYPNPVHDIFVVEAEEKELSVFKIYSPLGKDVTDAVEIHIDGNEKRTVSIGQLETGIYTIKTYSTVTKVVVE